MRYVYRREDGSTFEVEQRMSDAPLTECSETRQSVERVIFPAPTMFQGKGWTPVHHARG